MLQVSALYVYPIKSCAGISVAAANVESRGLQYDRRFMLVDKNGRFLTQRQVPQMALLGTAIEAGTLRVTRPGDESIEVPLNPAFDDTARVKIWRSELDASIAPSNVNGWFSEYLDRPVRLIYMADDQHRRVSRERATAADDEVSFADGAPILLIGEASLADLNARLAEPVAMLRFRPNIVVNTSEAFAEDHWRQIKIGTTPLEVAWSCARCTMTTVNPHTGVAEESREPLRTLRTFRLQGNAVMFGQNVLTRGSGQLRVGDHLTVVEKR